jgi:nucleolar MIF4G domain-containing protein 1
MVDTLTNLKSGKSKSANPDQGVEAAVRMKRFLGGLGRKRRRERELGAWRAARC